MSVHTLNILPSLILYFRPKAILLQYTACASAPRDANEHHNETCPSPSSDAPIGAITTLLRESKRLQVHREHCHRFDAEFSMTAFLDYWIGTMLFLDQ